MNDRSYLSIGDVLTLLREEFPDITISKIRFLESRGLLVPERTPSGYRKFYDHDVDRLRWILRQQRENFLPLKVIKGRLEGQEPSSEPTPLFEVTERKPSSLEPVFAGQPVNGAAGRAEEPAVASHAVHRGGGGTATALAEVTTATAAGPALRELSASGERGRATATATETPDSTGTPGSTETMADGAGAPEAGAMAAAVPSRPGHSAVTRQAAAAADAMTVVSVAGGGFPDTTGAGVGKEAAGAKKPLATAAGEADKVPAAATASGAGRPGSRPAPAAKSPASAATPADVAALAGASLTAAELAQASGLEVRLVEELESYGLIESRMIAGAQCFDEDALIVARLAASFAGFGVEARHLRLFKHAAERQASLYSQVVMPLLRQRNPEARRRAHDDLVQLSELGASLQTCFTKAVLRDLTRG